MVTTATNYDRVGQGLRLLQAALAPYVAKHLRSRYGQSWWTQGVYYQLPERDAAPLSKDGDQHDLAQRLDVAALLGLMDRQWADVFQVVLVPQKDHRTWVKECQSVRNRWAHHGGGDWEEDDAYRALDTIRLLLKKIDPEAAAKVSALAKAVRQAAEAAGAGKETPPSPESGRGGRRAAAVSAAAAPGAPAVASGPAASSVTPVPAQATLALGIKPWREVVQPHRDVQAGRLRQAEFAADLAQVLAGKAEREYQDPDEFFARTFLTQGMTELLATALARLTGGGGEPVVQLKTAFGGGKTHTMLALYHLVRSGPRAAALPGVDAVLAKAGITAAALPAARVAVLVGTALDPAAARPDKTGHGVTVRTLWGEMAAQLGGAEAYALVAPHDQAGVAPGSDTLVALFERFGPAVVLIDELVAYARNIGEKTDLPGGTFESNLTFVQALTEAAKRAGRSLVVASIPESVVEVGEGRGREAQAQLEHTFGRLEAVWKPVGALEGFEIVRRRLFADIEDTAARDRACRQFARLYGDGSGDFPREAGEADYLKRLTAAYPIHPELFDQLYNQWSTLERFQRTRGVLRLMAAVIHALWNSPDRSAMILPGNVPLDDAQVRDELLRYLPDTWNAVLGRDVDGPESEPVAIDGANGRFGGHLAARRLARAVFLGTAPQVSQQARRGVEANRIRLGVVQPNEPIAVFNDALGRLTERLTYLYAGDGRFWYDTRPNLRREAEDRAAALDDYKVVAEIERRLRQTRDRGDFAAVHVFADGGDIPDVAEARLVVLRPESTHKHRREDSPARQQAAAILEQRGSGPRLRKNMLVFAAPDEDAAESLRQATRQYLAWRAIVDEHETLNLDAHGRRQAAESKERWDRTAGDRLHEAYAWLLVPQQTGAGPWEWDVTRINGSTPVVGRASAKLRGSEQLITRWSPALLKMELDRWLWKGDVRDHYETRKLWDALASYGYLPRLANEQVLLDAIAEGLRSPDYFGFAHSVGSDGRYEGLRFNVPTLADAIRIDGQSVLVKPAAARRQLEADEAAERQRQAREADERRGVREDGRSWDDTPGRPKEEAGPPPPPPPPPRPAAYRRFHGTVSLDPKRINRDAGSIADEVVQHLTGLPRATVRVTIEIEAEIPEGAPDTVIRTVTENSRTLKFQTHSFEEQ